MAVELSYVLITPYTIVKSRTGGVIARLLSRLDLELVAAQIIAPDEKLTKAYAESFLIYEKASIPGSSKLLHDYVMNTFMPSEGRRHRVMMLVFRGEDAVNKVTEIVGPLYPDPMRIDAITGETIRDTYADLIFDRKDPQKVIHFEPAVLAPRTLETSMFNMKLFADFLKDQPNIIENIKYPDPSVIERTLVILKPDNWTFGSSRPGAIIDMFSRTGLRIIGCKIYKMPVSDALEFYGPVKDVLVEKLSPMFGKKAKAILEKEMQVVLDESETKLLTDIIGTKCAVDQFEQIVEFMTGVRPDACKPEDIDAPGKVKCMVLIYEGENAVSRIRKVLGPTDPSKAPSGTVRREFGQDVMVNTAHASDSAENAKREMGIIKIQKNKLADILQNYIKENENK